MTISEIKEKYSSVGQFEKIKRRIRNNKEVSFFYSSLAEMQPTMVYGFDGSGEYICKEVPSPVLMNKAKNVFDCCRYWSVDYYRLQGVKDLKQTNACHDRFCDNCQNAIAIQRARKFEPILDALAKNFDLYHFILTVPNCKREKLLGCLDNMSKQFGYLYRVLKGDAKIRSYDFSYLGCVGAVRAFEITKNYEENTLHPHLHCILILKKGLHLDANRRYVNTYSFDSEHVKRKHRKKKPGEPLYYFSDLEILLQKIWRLRIDGIRVNRTNIESLPIGYSVMLQSAEGNYKEVFKYATKGLFKKEKHEEDLEEFELVAVKLDRQLDFNFLYEALKGRRVVQGYGILQKFKFEDEVEQGAIDDDAYWKMILKLHELENPEQIFEFFDQIIENFEEGKMKNITYVSRKSIAEVISSDEGEWELKK